MVSQPIGSSFANGALLPNYVNGRLLAAEDLATSQSTLLQRDSTIGQAVGPGIVNGLWVTASATTLTVADGFGITPAGEPVSVPAPVALQLSMARASAAPTGGSFVACTTASSRPQTAITTGAYLLTATPASQLQGQAPMAIPPGSDTPVACTAQWQAAGVDFKAIPLQFTTQVDGVAEMDGITVTAHNCRNLLAHWCFGTTQLAGLGADPFNFNPAYRGLDQLAVMDLAPSDLPLCVFYWDDGPPPALPSISFVDNWPVRRRVTRPDASAPSWNWSAAVADQRSADGEARFRQFQDQILDLVSAGAPRATVASDVFGMLPPLGFLPVAVDSMAQDIAGLRQAATDLTPRGWAPGFQPTDILSSKVIDILVAEVSQLGAQPGFVPATFFGGLAFVFGGLLTWDIVYFALRQSYFVEPIATVQTQGADSAPDLQPTPFPIVQQGTASGGVPLVPFPDVIIYYYVAENYIGVYNAINGTGPTLTPYLVFMKNQSRFPDTQVPFAHVSAVPPEFTVQAKGFNTVTNQGIMTG